MAETFRESIRKKIENPVDTILVTGANLSDVSEAMETGTAALRNASDRLRAEGPWWRPPKVPPEAHDDSLQLGGA